MPLDIYTPPAPETDLHDPNEDFSVRGTFYFSDEMLGAFENALLSIRTKCKLRIRKSDAARIAFDFFIMDVNQNGVDSWVARRAMALPPPPDKKLDDKG